MFRYICLLIVLVFQITFAQVNDKAGLLSENDVEEIGKIVSGIEDETGLKYEINILKSDLDIDKDLNKYEKSVIINLVLQGEKKYKVSLNFSQEMEAASKKEEILEILGKSEKKLENGEFLEFFKILVNESSTLLLDDEVEDIPEKKKVYLIKYLIFFIPLLFWKKIVKLLKKLSIKNKRY